MCLTRQDNRVLTRARKSPMKLAYKAGFVKVGGGKKFLQPPIKNCQDLEFGVWNEDKAIGAIPDWNDVSYSKGFHLFVKYRDAEEYMDLVVRCEYDDVVAAGFETEWPVIVVRKIKPEKVLKRWKDENDDGPLY